MPKKKSTLDQAFDKLNLAGAYFDDGAPRSAARCLREAADLFEKHADECGMPTIPA